MVGDRLAELREHKALTLRDLEELSGVGADAISKIENGHRKPRPSTLRKLARALGVEVEDFFREPVPLGEALMTGPPQVSREDLAGLGVSAPDAEIRELNDTLAGLWDPKYAYVGQENVNTARVMMLMHLVLDTPSIIAPEAAGVLRQGMREKLKA